MSSNPLFLYAFTFGAALILSLILTPAARSAALLLKIMDHPITSVKTHKEPVPYLGGLAIFLAFAFALLWVRVLTSFPTGTLRALRGIVFGGGLIFLMGLVDDIRHGGLNYKVKFVIQFSAAAALMFFGIQLKFINPTWMGLAVSVLWMVAITNAFNIIDIMDGLSSGVAVIAALAFLFISLPTEEIYVNFAAAALGGAVLGFMPYNLSKSWRIFMGDSGSLLLGFVCGALAMGTSYGEKSSLGILAPLLILAVPLFDTTLVFCLRITRGMSPFLGSKDHFPLRLEALGWPRKKILIAIYFMATLFCAGAAEAVKLEEPINIIIYALFFVFLCLFTLYVLRVKVK